MKHKELDDYSFIVDGVMPLENSKFSAAFSSVNSSEVFRENGVITPIQIGKKMYMPWGYDNQLPYNIIDLIESDETLSTCQLFNAEICYGDGLRYCDEHSTPKIQEEISEFFLENVIPSYFLGVCQDMKYFMFSVSVIILNADGSKIVRLVRKEACYCRFAPADKYGNIKEIIYANWRNSPSEKDIEVIELLNMNNPWGDLNLRMGRSPGKNGEKVKSNIRKFAIITKFPTPDSTYYPIPYYASLFRGSWFDIKKLIGMGKKAKISNTAPIKYHIEIHKDYWKSLFENEGITSKEKMRERIITAKAEIISFLTGVENSGKAWFSSYYVDPNGKEQSYVRINEITTTKEGGDWASDIIEAVNMICFTMRVHSNLVGSVPGKSQSNNSGSDKRELYTIAQALQKPYHDLMFLVHRIIIKYNGWIGAHPDCPFIQLTTLDENKDAKKVTTNKPDPDDDESNNK